MDSSFRWDPPNGVVRASDRKGEGVDKGFYMVYNTAELIFSRLGRLFIRF